MFKATRDWKFELLKEDFKVLQGYYATLRIDHDLLVKALGLTKDARIINEYVKKGGVER